MASRASSAASWTERFSTRTASNFVRQALERRPAFVTGRFTSTGAADAASSAECFTQDFRAAFSLPWTIAAIAKLAAITIARSVASGSPWALVKCPTGTAIAAARPSPLRFSRARTAVAIAAACRLLPGRTAVAIVVLVSVESAHGFLLLRHVRLALLLERFLGLVDAVDPEDGSNLLERHAPRRDPALDRRRRHRDDRLLVGRVRFHVARGPAREEHEFCAVLRKRGELLRDGLDRLDLDIRLEGDSDEEFGEREEEVFLDVLANLVAAVELPGPELLDRLAAHVGGVLDVLRVEDDHAEHLGELVAEIRDVRFENAQGVGGQHKVPDLRGRALVLPYDSGGLLSRRLLAGLLKPPGDWVRLARLTAGIGRRNAPRLPPLPARVVPRFDPGLDDL